MMKKLWFAVAATLTLGCGAVQSWEGTYSGSVRRAATAEALATGAAAQETWTVSELETGGITAVRARPDEPNCTFQATHGGDGGGYALTLTSGATCTIDDVQRTLRYGNLLQQNENEYLIELRWGETAEAITLHEEGTLDRSTTH